MEEKLLPSLKDASSDEVVTAIVEILDSKSAHDIKVMKVSEKTVLTEYFVICSGNSNTQRRALCGYIEEGLEKRDLRASRIEGYDEGSWIVMDYFNVIVHIFDSNTRDFYKLEKLWHGANEVMLNSDKQGE